MSVMTTIGMLAAVGGLGMAGGESWQPRANPESVVVVGNARFTMLTPRMIRLEYSDTGAFEDRASLAFVNRALPAPEFSKSTADGKLLIQTEYLKLTYAEKGGRFSDKNLSIEFKLDDKPVVWRPGIADTGNLRGTTRTLDSISGACPLEPGLLSRDGWVLVDDAPRIVFDDSEWPWAAPRKDPKAIDWYFLGYGRNYRTALLDYTRVAGRIPLPPRFVFGAWWSRYWAYTDAELRQLVTDFQKNDVPLDVLVIDMDWHLDGWTGYSWNPKYFPDPDGFLKWVHAQGLRATLNLHPADGVGKHEKAFPEVAKAMGLDPTKVDAVPFDCIDRKYVDAYFKFLHHPLEKQGIDFWWIDWQQGKQTKLAGLDPLVWLNYLHFTDMQRNPENKGKRPLIFSRWGGLGNHRYQIGFSGDTYCDWQSLAFQPYFTSTAGNVGYAYWSHDIGGHQPGKVDPELYVRWIQWGALSPALRTHTTKNAEAERRIWAFPSEFFSAAREAYQLRYALIPYIYTSARKCFDSAEPLCRPLYYHWPDSEESYNHPGEYMLGDDLLCAPVVAPRNGETGLAQSRVWVPPGQWVHWSTGQAFAGPREITLLTPLNETPILVRDGAIIPEQPKMRVSNEKPVDPLILNVFGGTSGTTLAYEDDGETEGYQRGEAAWTPVQSGRNAAMRFVNIGPVQGEFPSMLKQRAFEVRIRDEWVPPRVLVNGTLIARNDKQDGPGWWYDADSMSVVIRTPPCDVKKRTEIAVEVGPPRTTYAYFQQGLRGYVRQLVSLAAELGDKTPPSVRRAVEFRTVAANDRANAEAMAGEISEGLPTVLSELAGCGAPDAVVRKAVAKLLGLSWEIRAMGVQGAAAATIEATAQATASPLSSAAGLCAAEISIAEPKNWKIVSGARSAASPAMAPHEPITARIRLSRDGAPCAERLDAKLVVRVGGKAYEWTTQQGILPSVNAWRVVGPFETPFDKALDLVLPPEEKLDASATYEGKGGTKLAWTRVERNFDPAADLMREFYVNFHNLLGERHYDAVAYAWTEIRCPSDVEAVFALGSDDGAKVWVNGAVVYTNAVGRSYSPRQDRFPVKLKKGPNVVLVKVSQGGGDWGFSLHVEDKVGKEMSGLEATLAP